jgi:N-acetylglucosaminyldiphosphoundecaprenol N-acetyl-beta-D-mannosaminyltransferase
MKECFLFTGKDPMKIIGYNTKKVMNFENMYSLYLFKNEDAFRREMVKKHNITFPDGKKISRYLKIKQQRGPSFTRKFLLSKKAKGKKHFFIGSLDLDIISEKTKIPKEDMRYYNPPYLKSKMEFSIKEKRTIVGIMKHFSPDYVWVCIGNPKQEILANQLYELYPSIYLSVGAALDFLTEKKAEAPEILRVMGIEWLYRLITDFKYVKRKAWGSFVALKYLKYIKLEKKK